MWAGEAQAGDLEVGAAAALRAVPPLLGAQLAFAGRLCACTYLATVSVSRCGVGRGQAALLGAGLGARGPRGALVGAQRLRLGRSRCARARLRGSSGLECWSREAVLV